jgi:uncharacterized membrane protein YbhN (UPF0104 family)
VLFQQTVEACLLAGCASLGVIWLPESPERTTLARSCVAVFLVLASLCAILASPAPRWRWLERIRQVRLLRTHRLARPHDFVALALLKGGYYAIFLLVYAVGTRAFGIELAWPLVVTAVPIIQAIGSIPITPAGLGTQQAAMVFFFSGYGTESAIMAFGLAFPIAQTAFRCLIGLLYVDDLRHARRSRSRRDRVSIAGPQRRKRR